MSGGRPLRFLALTLGGWTLGRIAVLLSEIAPPSLSTAPPILAKIVVPPAAATLRPRPRPTAFFARASIDTVAIATGPALLLMPQPRRTAISPGQPPRLLPAPPPLALLAPLDALPGPPGRLDTAPLLIAPPFTVRGAGRLNASAWMLVHGGPAGTVSGGQLGASQAGLRITYAIDDARRFALSARLASPFKGRGREVALGVAWQPTRLPIRLIAEQRFVLDGGRSGPTIGVVGGYGPSDIAPGVRLETYGQAGAIARDGVETFVDAAARLTHPIGTAATVRVDIGIGAWASAQRDAERFDIGPSVVATLPVARTALRLSLDWRERIGGTARPGSGPALSIGSDF